MIQKNIKRKDIFVTNIKEDTQSLLAYSFYLLGAYLSGCNGKEDKGYKVFNDLKVDEKTFVIFPLHLTDHEKDLIYLRVVLNNSDYVLHIDNNIEETKALLKLLRHSDNERTLILFTNDSELAEELSKQREELLNVNNLKIKVYTKDLLEKLESSKEATNILNTIIKEI